ncbi:response regulator [Sphingomonas naphthae]|uniref:histidine kinase n=1 Tax=Sphingomonas naphthae TaxID=1813468 RepID=A0ABY7TPH4_9SPHN|nr:ATP-binding protein [Sphingomonas naphthae]WCT74886.1 response regulator [Sphingomonas naphthae]
MASSALPSQPTRPREWWKVAVVVKAAILSVGLIWASLANLPIEGILGGAAIGVALILVTPRLLRGRQVVAAPTNVVDWPLVAAALDDNDSAVAITDRRGLLVCANRTYEHIFEGLDGPLSLGADAGESERLSAIAHAAWREGEARGEGIGVAGGGATTRVHVRRGGIGEDYLIWRFGRTRARNATADAVALVDSAAGGWLGHAGVMAVVVDRLGMLLAANAVYRVRAFGDAAADPAGQPFADALTNESGQLRFVIDGEDDDAVRIIHVPLDEADPEGDAILLLIDEEEGAGEPRQSATASVYGLLATLPLGLALTERDGRFLFMNAAFGQAAGVGGADGVLFPSDLVVDEDKATVSEAVRRFSAGRALPGDLAVRFKARPEEPVALTIAGARGLGEASVLLSLKDNSEESKLKRQVAQATKMQAVGQLAGGVAHDFNNILTAIIGHCDLMLMRHSPGDIDYDDIQQVKHNSNRAASLTRQLLAFSRQQTLRPQVLQLPDVISEISHLLKRLLGETVTLTVKHGRNLGYVRADPGQLEQVIVNLAVNARDAMPDGGTLSVQTYMMSAADVRRMDSDIVPVADYVALSVSDTGTGIPIEIQGKIFEPFFTTKEVGKGTGLGLSTVYGIVKQTGGFIFAESAPGQGTTFVIYLPVHQAADQPLVQPLAPKIEPASDLWGTGTILLVEDDAMVRAVAERSLSRQGYRILTATNGEEALELIGQGEEIDLLISDVVMPTMDGPTLVRHARARHPDIPVLFMSGYAEEQLRRSIDIDRVNFLPKPFSVQQLATAAKDTLAASKG